MREAGAAETIDRRVPSQVRGRTPTRTRTATKRRPGRRPLADVAADVEPVQRALAARVTKRAIDIAGSLIGLAVLAPVLVIVAVIVKLSSRGPALFVQERCGLGGRLFRFYKFRTMVEDAEDRRAELEHLNEMTGPVFKIRRDPRITRVGRMLRKTSLDELPQLWNVLVGDMSLVGPRPPIPEEVERYTAYQAQRLAVVPGITGLWQVTGRSSLPDFDEWLELDLEYQRRWSLWLDVRILLKTVVVVALAKGAQ
jgi:exopolysaccharide biosynthesis polyprenyl glycosylphosphotransferase